MCGIFGIVSKESSSQLTKDLIKGLERLEYRGYDSAGIATINGGTSIIEKRKGYVERLKSHLKKKKWPKQSTGIAHTRWATHGVPSDTNAHPHTDCTGQIAVVHNGIIENYAEMREKLKKRGHKFKSNTDTEVLSHLVEESFKLKKVKTPLQAVKNALSVVKGTYGIAVLHSDFPGQLVAARLGSPLVVGKGKDGTYVASDPVCLGSFTKQLNFLEDNDIVVLKPDTVSVYHHTRKQPKDAVFELQEELGAWESKGNYKHYMLKEIFDQSQALADGLRGRVPPNTGKPNLGGLTDVKEKFENSSRIVIVACGTSYYAAQCLQYWFEDIAKVPTVIEDAGELRNRDFEWYPGDTAIFISQSGETADLMAALKIAKSHGVLCLGMVNVVGSSVARMTDAGIYLRAGPEIGVASTKAFTSQLLAGLLMAISIGRKRRKISSQDSKKLLKKVRGLPRLVKKVLDKSSSIQRIANELTKSPYLFYIGRWLSYPIALEGALKMKEIAYIFSEGLSASGIKHGPLALIQDNIYTVAVIPNDKTFKSTMSNICEIRARKGKILAITDNPSKELKENTDHIIEIPKTHDLLSPFLSVVVLQLLAYYAALKLKRPIDKPRNLAKSVTVE